MTMKPHEIFVKDAFVSSQINHFIPNPGIEVDMVAQFIHLLTSLRRWMRMESSQGAVLDKFKPPWCREPENAHWRIRISWSHDNGNGFIQHGLVPTLGMDIH